MSEEPKNPAMAIALAKAKKLRKTKGKKGSRAKDNSQRAKDPQAS